MIDLRFNLSNPFSDRWANIRCWSGSTPFETKFWELQLMKTNGIIGFGTGVSTRCDHAGFRFEITLLGYELAFNFYDNRHWNYEEGRWEIYPDEGRE